MTPHPKAAPPSFHPCHRCHSRHSSAVHFGRHVPQLSSSSSAAGPAAFGGVLGASGVGALSGVTGCALWEPQPWLAELKGLLELVCCPLAYFLSCLFKAFLAFLSLRKPGFKVRWGSASSLQDFGRSSKDTPFISARAAWCLAAQSLVFWRTLAS